MKPLLLVALASALVQLAAPPAARAGDRPIDALGWLVGGVWSADATKLGPGVQHIDTRYEWAPNKSFIRFTTAFVSAEASKMNYAGNLFFDPASENLMMWYMDAGNHITQGRMVVDGPRWTQYFTASGEIVRVNGPVDFRCDVLRTSPDAYTWTLLAREGAAYKTVFSLDYVRASRGP